MAMKFRDYESTYNGRIVSTASEKDLRFLYEDERLSTTEIANVFENKLSNKTVARRLSKYGICARDNKGESNPMWAGGKKNGKGGYTLLWNPSHPNANAQGYVSEHRLVMEMHLGRHLNPEEVVHHINKDRKDNRIDNLQLMESNSAHAKLESELRNRDSKGRFVS